MRYRFGSLMSNAWAREFRSRVRDELAGAPAADPRAADRIVDAAQRLFDERKAGLRDRQAAQLLVMCSLILAAYRELGPPAGGGPEALAVVGRALRATFRGRVQFVTRALLWLSRDPVRGLSRVSISGFCRWAYGDGMAFGQTRSAESVELLVHKCAFHEFFAENGSPELTRVLCMWDRNWMDVVNASPRPVRIERRSTISTGGERCEFRFVRDAAKAGKTSEDVVSAGTPRAP
jgi:hypothetical protein